MALNNPMSIREAVDQVIGTFGDRIAEIGVDEDDWRDLCDEIGHDPVVVPAIYRGTKIVPSARGFDIWLTDWR